MTRRPLQASGAAFITGCVSIPASVPVVAADGAGPVSTLELFAGFSGAASTAAAFVSAASSSAPDGGLKMRLAREPRGACIGGGIWGLTSGLTPLIFDLGTEFVRGAAEFVHDAADLASDLGQLLGAEKDQRQEEEKDHLAREAE